MKFLLNRGGGMESSLIGRVKTQDSNSKKEINSSEEGKTFSRLGTHSTQTLQMFERGKGELSRRQLAPPRGGGQSKEI